MIRKQHMFLFGGGVMIFILFTFFSFIVDKEMLRQLDFDTTVILQNALPRRVDGFFSLFSFFGNFEILILLLVLLLVLLKRLLAGLFAFFAFGLFHIIEIFGKTVVEQLPPPQFMLRTEHAFDFPQFHVRLEYSYPSGHSGRTTFLAVLLLFFIWKSNLSVLVKGILMSGVVGFTFLMLLSRVYLGEHWTTDVIGGALLALSLALVSVGMYHMRFKRRFL